MSAATVNPQQSMSDPIEELKKRLALFEATYKIGATDVDPQFEATYQLEEDLGATELWIVYDDISSTKMGVVGEIVTIRVYSNATEEMFKQATNVTEIQ